MQNVNFKQAIFCKPGPYYAFAFLYYLEKLTSVFSRQFRSWQIAVIGRMTLKCEKIYTLPMCYSFGKWNGGN